jgi:PAS domain-containing protein
MNQRANKINSTRGQLKIVKENIESINTSHLKILVNLIAGCNTGQESLDNINQEITYSLLKIREITSSIEKKKAFMRKPEIVSALTAFHNNMDDFSSNNLIVISSLKERGNFSEGIIFKWLKQINELENIISASDKSYLPDIFKMHRLQAEYLITHEGNIINELNNIIMELQNELSMSDIEGSEQLTTFLNITAQLDVIDKRLGISSVNGELQNYQNAYKALTTAFDYVNTKIDEQIRKIIVLNQTAGYTLIFLLFIGFIVISNLIFRKNIQQPIHVIKDFVSKLSEGLLPEKQLNINADIDPGGLSVEVNKLTEGLIAKTHFARDLNQGNYNTEIKLLSENDALGIEMKKLQENIISAAHEQARYNEENAKRRYINEGLAKFGNVLRLNSNDLIKLGDSFIRELVNYLNAIQGGVFLLEEKENEKPVLNLISSFAYNRKKYLEKTILVGEGLVGTCAIEKKTIHLTEIPKEYISITSGLGDAPPDNLLLIPVIHEETLIGVLEIASLKAFKDFEITFAEEVANSLASTIISTRINQKTAELLAKSQQQAQEMKEQEEEMRQNMEELKATQEESSRREQEFHNILNSLNLSVFMLEYNLDGKIIAANNKFLLLINKKLEDISGKPHSYIFGKNTAINSLFWSQLKNISNSTIIEKLTIGNKTYYIKEHFNLVNNKEGLPVKVINIMTDIPDKIKI